MSRIFLVTWVAGWLVGAAGFAAELDPQQPSIAERTNPVEYQVDLTIAITAPYKTKKLQVWLPIPPSESGQEYTRQALSVRPQSIQPQFTAEKTFGNQFAYFEFEQPQGAQLIRHQFTLKVWELRWNLQPEKILEVRTWPATFEPYRRSEERSVVINSDVERLLSEVVAKRTTPLADFGRVFGWAEKNLIYDHDQASLQASALHALTNRRGHCSDYHGLCASLGRAMGYPTRVTYGLNTFPKNSPSHCKLEVFLPPYGWVSFDVSETQKLIAAIGKDDSLSADAKAERSSAARSRLLSGFRDNTWFVQTRGTDYDLAPPASRRVPVVRTIYAEADGVPLPDPDPANKKQTEFAWMTVLDCQPDHPISYPFNP
jgi:transglutaminase-like putative cysteine protease